MIASKHLKDTQKFGACREPIMCIFFNLIFQLFQGIAKLSVSGIISCLCLSWNDHNSCMGSDELKWYIKHMMIDVFLSEFHTCTVETKPQQCLYYYLFENWYWSFSIERKEKSYSSYCWSQLMSIWNFRQNLNWCCNFLYCSGFFFDFFDSNQKWI